MVAFIDKLVTEDGKPLSEVALDAVRRLKYNIDDESIAKDKRGGTLTERERIAVEFAKSETYAKATELLLGKKSGEIINKLVDSDRSLARKLLTKIKDAAKIIDATFKGDGDEVQTLKLMREAEKHFTDALAASGTGYYHGKEIARKEAQKQESKRNEFNTLAMQWAYSDKTQVGERTIRYRFDNAVVLEKTNDGFVEVREIKMGHKADISNVCKEIGEHNARLHETLHQSIDEYEYSGRNDTLHRGTNVGESRNDRQNGRVYQEQSGRNGDGTHQQGTGNQSEIKESRRGYAGRNPADVTEQEYNHHYWAVANDVLSTKESGALRSAVGEINQGTYYPQTSDGKYMVAVGENGVLNKIVFTDGGQESYSVEKVIEIDLDNETELSVAREIIYERENVGVSTEDSSILKIHFGDDVNFFEFSRKLKENARNSYVEQDGRRSGTETENRTGNEVKHSLRDVDGEKVVVVDTDQSLFEGVEKEKLGKVVQNYMRDRYRGKVIEGTTFTKTSELEYTHSRDTQRLYNKQNGAYEAKMRVSAELNNLLKTCEFIGHEESKHPKVINEGGFNRYSAKFILENKYFTGELLIAIDKKGVGTFYDMIKIKEGNSVNISPNAEGRPNTFTNSILQNSEKSTGDDKIKHSRRKKSDADRLLDEVRGHLDMYPVEDGYRIWMVEVPDAESLFADDPEGLKLANQVIRMASDSSEPNRTAFAEEIAMHIIDNAIITNRDLDAERFDREQANIIRRYMHSVDLRGIMDELVYTYDKKGANNIRLVWGATKNGPSIHVDDAIMELRGYGG